MASEAEFAEGGFKQLASVSSTMAGMLPAGAAIGMVVERGRIRRRMKDSTSVEIRGTR